jgi:oxysterol-binding protein 1
VSNPAPDKNDWQYKFTNFSFILNNLPEDLKPLLPRSDSRFRTDQRALEEGKFELAAEEKHRLEEKQRAARKYRAENPGKDFTPKYFK